MEEKQVKVMLPPVGTLSDMLDTGKGVVFLTKENDHAPQTAYEQGFKTDLIGNKSHGGPMPMMLYLGRGKR
ncbi:hypothetical protein UY3_14474 [Chelonia mydas]|uniref:Uncharacterized protein n=1 Tax=Chelonia mydas TaxID=8469 RepID=M7B8F0_CHEMY|nr:hypothetical protein UY3_14474 [Chelonia mydas]